MAKTEFYNIFQDSSKKGSEISYIHEYSDSLRSHWDLPQGPYSQSVGGENTESSTPLNFKCVQIKLSLWVTVASALAVLFYG